MVVSAKFRALRSSMVPLLNIQCQTGPVNFEFEHWTRLNSSAGHLLDHFAICEPARSRQWPRVKSGNFIGALPFSTDARLNGPGDDHAAAS